MLIVRRRRGESILIADSIEVQILEISGNQVKLGVIAPREITVLRREIAVTIQQNAAAAELTPRKLEEARDILSKPRSESSSS